MMIASCHQRDTKVQQRHIDELLKALAAMPPDDEVPELPEEGDESAATDETEGLEGRLTVARPDYAIDSDSPVFSRTLDEAKVRSPRAIDASDIRLTVFESVQKNTGGTDMSLAEIMCGMKAGELLDKPLVEHTAACRTPDVEKDRKNDHKRQLPVMMICGTLHDGSRKSDRMQVAVRSNLIQIDIDLPELERTGLDAGRLIERFKADPHMAMVFRSPSGACKGLLAVEAFENPRHAFLCARRYVHETYGVRADDCAERDAQGSYVPHDPDVYLNPTVFPLPWTEWKTFTVVREETGLEPWEVASQQGGYIAKSLSEAFWARMLAADCPLLYHPGQNRFHRYDRSSGIWKPVANAVISQRLIEMLERADRSMSNNGNPTYPDGMKANQPLPGLQRLIKNKFQTETLKLLQSMVTDTKPFCGPDDGLKIYKLAFANHMVVIDESRQPAVWWSEPHRADHRLTHGIDMAFNGQAKCPRFRSELLPQLHSDDRRLLELYMGQILLQRNITQTFTILEGPGNDGKSTVANILAKIAGRENHGNLRTGCLKDRFETGRLSGKTLLVGRDVKQTFLSEDGADMIKALVGGDLLHGELKYSNEVFDVPGIFNIMVTTNLRQRLPVGGGDVDAWRRRLLFIRLDTVRTGTSVPRFEDVLWDEEGEGIVRLALERLLQLLSTGVSNRWAFGLTTRQVALAEELVAGSDSLRLFVAECIEKKARSFVRRECVAEAYDEYCRVMGFPAEQRHGFYQRIERWTLEMLGVSWSNNPRYGGRALVGVHIKPIER